MELPQYYLAYIVTEHKIPMLGTPQQSHTTSVLSKDRKTNNTKTTDISIHEKFAEFPSFNMTCHNYNSAFYSL
jgi:hypothetical protein